MSPLSVLGSSRGAGRWSDAAVIDSSAKHEWKPSKQQGQIRVWLDVCFCHPDDRVQIGAGNRRGHGIDEKLALRPTTNAESPFHRT